MAYDKNAVSGTIFDEVGYDEMQKSENHEIGFRLFRVMFFVVLAASFILIVICGNANDFWGMAVSLVLLAVVFVFYIIYAYMTAKKGIMNPKFAKGWSAKWIIPAYIILEAAAITRIFHSEHELIDIALIIQWQMIIISCISISLCAKKNNRVVKKQLEEE